MGIRKYASLAVLEAWQVPVQSAGEGLQKFAHRVDFDYTPRPGYLYVRSRAISSRANDNHDEFPADEIAKSYRTFLGKPCFVNHHNANHRRARGVIVAVALHRDKAPDGRPDTWAECLMEIDAVRYPKLAKAIIEGRVNRTSMGVDVEESECTACGNKASDPAQYCQHLPQMKGRKIRRRDAKTGKLKEEIIREICRGLSFFENSLLVEEPADPTAYVLGTPDARGLKMAASRHTADAMDETPGSGEESATGEILRHLQEMHGTPEMGAAFLGQEIFKKIHGRPIHSGYGEDPGKENVAAHNEWLGHYARSYADLHEALHLAHQKLHGFRHDEPHTPNDNRYPLPGRLWRGEGATGESQVPEEHEHHLTDPLITHPKTVDPVWSDPTNREFFTPTDSRVLSHPYSSEMRLSDRIQEKPYNRFHPERTDRYPNREIHETGDDPAQWSNLGNCSRTYTHEQQNRAYNVTKKLDDIEPQREDPDYSHEKWRAWHDQKRKRGATCPECGAYKWMHAEHRPSEIGRPTPKYQQEMRQSWDERVKGKTGPFMPTPPHLSMRRQAITGESAPESSDIFAAPTGESPVAHHYERLMDHPEERNIVVGPHGPEVEHPHLSAPDHGPYYVTRHPDGKDIREATYHVLDREGRETHPGGGYRSGMFSGHYGAYQDWYRLQHHQEPPEPGQTMDLIQEHQRHAAEHPPQFPHSRIDPKDEEIIARRPDARMQKPEGYSPEDEWHGPYEVVKHPETGKFHVVDNAGRHAPGMGSWQGHKDQLHAERSRDYIDKRQQAKDRGAQIARDLYEGFQQIMDPGSTPESRQSTRNLERGQDLMTRYAGGRGHIKFDDEEEGGDPYYERDHFLPNGNRSGWYTKHYGGPRIDMYHRATPDEAHDLVRLPEHPEDKESMSPRLHPDFDDHSLQKAMDEWYHESPGENAAREYYETDSHAEPRIRRWKQRWPNGQPPPRQASLQAEARGYDTAADHPWFKANPVDHMHIVHAYHDSTADEHAQGHRWYSDAHHVAKAIAGGDAARGAGLLAAYSPRTAWPINMFNASKAHRDNKAFGGPGEGAMGLHKNLAAPIIAGIHHTAAFRKSAPKIRAFAHLIEHGGDTEEETRNGTQKVVVDRHALSAAIGRRVSDADLDAVSLDTDKYYNHVADAYHRAAAHLSGELGHHIAPHQVQATVWIRQLRLNTAEDAESRGATGKGRVSRDRNAWARWKEHVQQHHNDVLPDNMHIGELMRRQAYGETKVPQQVNTLRQEECPVCNEAEVWTGQRCPVCGYVAPPDMFRDPDVDKAAQVREELAPEENAMGAMPGNEVPPAGQGSWPAADEQLFHPDQIAPNGVPAVAPEGEAETQLDQDGEEQIDSDGDGIPDEEEELTGLGDDEEALAEEDLAEGDSPEEIEDDEQALGEEESEELADEDEDEDEDFDEDEDEDDEPDERPQRPPAGARR